MKLKRSKPEKNRQSHSTTSSTSYKLFVTTLFLSEARRLKKKYPNIKKDFNELRKRLKIDPIIGNDPLGMDCYKVRMAITDKNSGESGGARIIIEVKIVDKAVYLLSVYDKAEKGSLFDNELTRILKKKILQHSQD